MIGERDVVERTCGGCGRTYDRVRGYVYRDGDAHAVYFAECHGHPAHEVWIDVILGSWGEDDYADHVTFACRVSAAGASAVDAPAATSGRSPMFGLKLGREAALVHRALPLFWDVVDLVVLSDESVRAEIEASA